MSSGFLWLAASTGLLSLLTPCVFPMVPVTIAYFSGAEHRSDKGLRRVILFGAGIVSTFTVLGLALAAVFGAAGLNRSMRMIFDGRLPANTRCGTSQSAVPSALTCSRVLPNASASVCANTFASSIS